MTTNYLQIAKLLFPFDFKTGQEACLEQLTDQPHVLWQAQTGFGKTLLSLCATLPYVLDPQHPLKQIIVFVRTKTQIFRFFDDVKKVSDQFLQHQKTILAHLNLNPYFPVRPSANPFLALPLVSKQDLCVLHSPDEQIKISCRDLKCPLFNHSELSVEETETIKKHFFSSTPQSSTAVLSLFSTVTNKKKCAYHSIRGLFPRADIIVTTQAWLYDPLRTIIERQFFNKPSKLAIIVDEAHNLRSLSIKKVSYEFFESFLASPAFSTLHKELLSTCKSHLHPASHQWFTRPDQVDTIQSLVTSLLATLNKTTSEYSQLKEMQDFLQDAGDHWFSQKDSRELGHISFTPVTAQGNFLLASKIILMSGTIHPPPIFALLFQLAKFTIIVMPTQERKVAKTVFSSELLTSKLENRGDALYRSLCRIVVELHSLNSKGHTFVFNPSNDFKEKMFQLLTESNKDTHFTIRMEQDSVYNQQLIDELKSIPNCLVVANLNGSFNEGIEVKDPITKKSKINLIIITGMPIHPPSIENYIIDRVFLQKYGPEVADYVRNFLPINQILLQTVGRGVRGENDSCWVVCTDYRIMRYHLWENYGIVNSMQDFELLKMGLQKYFTEIY